MKKKVLFCIPPSCGGAERVTLTIAKLLDREKYDVKVIIIGRTIGEIKEFIPDYMEIIHIKIWNIWDFTTWRLVKVFKKEKPDIVFCSLIALNVRVILAAKIKGNIKIIIRNNNSINQLRFDISCLVKLLYPIADVIILQTDEMKNEIKKHLKIEKEKLHTIFNPIDKETINNKLRNSLSPFDKKYINYVFVGRIDYVKGLDILLDSFSKIVKRNNNTRLYIIGKKYVKSSQYLNLLNKKISDAHLEENVIWIGFTSNPYQYIKYADCFVLPSRREGLPNVLLDALYLKVPVVATRSVPVIDRIVSKENGFVVDVNDVDALTYAMENATKIIVNEKYEISSNKEFIALFH